MPMPVSRTVRWRRGKAGGGGASSSRSGGQFRLVHVARGLRAAASDGPACKGACAEASSGLPSTHASTTTSPAPVNLTALLNRLASTCGCGWREHSLARRAWGAVHGQQRRQRHTQLLQSVTCAPGSAGRSVQQPRVQPSPRPPSAPPGGITWRMRTESPNRRRPLPSAASRQ